MARRTNPLEHVKTAKSLLAVVFPAGNTLRYQWHFESNQAADENAMVICSMARLITHLGQHQDTVYVRGEIVNDVESSDDTDVMKPIERNDGNWTSPKAGSLDAYRQSSPGMDERRFKRQCAGSRATHTLSLPGNNQL